MALMSRHADMSKKEEASRTCRDEQDENIELIFRHADVLEDETFMSFREEQK